jgi:hypothetical protein
MAEANLLATPAEFDPRKGRIDSSESAIRLLHFRIAQQSIAGSLPAMSTLAFEFTVLENFVDDAWDQMGLLIRDPFVTEKQHREITRRIPFALIDAIVSFFVAFVRKSQTLSLNGIFTSKGSSFCHLGTHIRSSPDPLTLSPASQPRQQRPH